MSLLGYKILYLLAVLSLGAASVCAHPQAKHLFAVADDISLARFVNVMHSPDDRWIVVQTERGSLEDDALHETIRVYSLTRLEELLSSADAHAISPEWSFERTVAANGDEAAGIVNLKWLANSTGFAFMLKTGPHQYRLYIADIHTQTVSPLSSAEADVLGFAIKDSSHYVFTVRSHAVVERLRSDIANSYVVGTGSDVDQLTDPESRIAEVQRSDLWAAVGGLPRQVRDPATGRPVELFSAGNDSLALSPDGTTLVTLRPVADVPSSWVRRYPPPYPDDPFGFHAHLQDLDAPADFWSYVNEWVSIDLLSGRSVSLTGAPSSETDGWWEVYEPTAHWSDDGSTVVLPGSFWSSAAGVESRPCVLAVDVRTTRSECVRPLKRQLKDGYEKGWTEIDHIDFAPKRNDVVVTTHDDRDDARKIVQSYCRSEPGVWEECGQKSSDRSGPDVEVQQDYRNPPMLVAADRISGKSAVVFDPNPQLHDVTMGQPEMYDWTDSSGRKWTGILYKPVGYNPHRRYPLVIQTHGYFVNQFLPSGSYTSAFVAQELASAGILVLQMGGCLGVTATAREAPCNVRGFQGAIETLARQGHIDPDRIGIIGFSRTVYYVLAALTSKQLRFKAASITDGVTYGYWDFLESIRPAKALLHEELSIYGAEPIGDGLFKWAKQSPVFNLSSVMAPVRIVAKRGTGVIDMWEPYALLRAMHKPVDLIALNTDQHVIVEPRIRFAAQGGNVDWFRFWLQGYEDPAPVKVEQYRRWEDLCNIQKNQHSEEPTYCVASKR